MSAWVTLSSLPELRRLSSAQKRGVVNQTLRSSGMIHLTLAMILGLGAGILTLTVLLHLLRQAFGPLGVAIGGSLLALLVCGLLHQFFTRMSRHGVRAVMKQHLRGGRFGVCMECGYDQRGHHRTTCPECGASIVVPPHSHRRAA